jgi:regulator of protease activity HflC (stomatin/prohibitin superfamily)
MKRFVSSIILGAMAFVLAGCHIVEQGTVGLRVNFDKTIEQTERQPGSFNQVLFGSMIDFPIKEIAVDVTNLTPLAADNSTMSDFDVTVVYNVNPASVSDLYINKNRTFHSLSEHGDVLLMHSYLQTTVRNAVYKVARKYEAMKMNDERQNIENEILAQVKETLVQENLGTSVNVSQVQVKSISPSVAVKAAADNLVKAKSDLQAKNVEVETANKEAQRMAALAQNAGQSIAYMQAQADLQIAEAVAHGKVNTIIIPRDFKGMVNTK